MLSSIWIVDHEVWRYENKMSSRFARNYVIVAEKYIFT